MKAWYCIGMVLLFVCNAISQELALKSKGFEQIFEPPQKKKVVEQPPPKALFSIPPIQLQQPLSVKPVLLPPAQPLPKVFKGLVYESTGFGSGNAKTHIDTFGWTVLIGGSDKHVLRLPYCQSTSPSVVPAHMIGLAVTKQLR